MTLAELFDLPLPTASEPLWQQLQQQIHADEAPLVAAICALLPLTDDALSASEAQASSWIAEVRRSPSPPLAQQLLHHYRLDGNEGRALMTLAEALPRISDSATASAFIADRLQRGQWQPGTDHQGWLKAAGHGLGLASRLVSAAPEPRWWQRLTSPLTARIIRRAIGQLGGQFVLGQQLPAALKAASRQRRELQLSHSFDMLGEAAQSAADARRYAERYQQAIAAVAASRSNDGVAPATVSIKLSALHPRYQASQQPRVLAELGATLTALVTQARALDVSLQLDAEECARHSLLLQLFSQQLEGPARGWGGLGIVVQAYAKWALPTLVWLANLGQQTQTAIPLRLVKGAYWDSEIKHAQAHGLSHYPLFTSKRHTDLNYLLCARYLLGQPAACYLQPAFATHNAQTLASVLALAGDRPFEWQRLWGMGDELSAVVRASQPQLVQRIYAPVGEHRDLLPYLIRRLLENGANSAFVHQLADGAIAVDQLARHPLRQAGPDAPLLPLPAAIFGQRQRARGLDPALAAERLPLQAALAQWRQHQWQASAPGDSSEPWRPCRSPQNPQDLLGHCRDTDHASLQQALARSALAFGSWQQRPLAERTALLEQAALLFEQHQPELLALCVREAGKTLNNAIDELREAVDFLRYYASEARSALAPGLLPAITGERNELRYEGRGPLLCISPWNFPLAIFTGQIAAALVAGNTVLAKPAEQTPLIAARAIALLHLAGIPAEVVQLLPGPGETIGAQLVRDPRIAGVIFTGSEATARAINLSLAQRPGPLLPLIAETGGLNAMVVDETALAEQVVSDLLRSAFDSAGQRCSACRLLLVQQELAEPLITALSGAMAELTLGDPWLLETDIGPVIDADAQAALEAHINAMRSHGRLLSRSPAPASDGHFVAPTLIELDSLAPLQQEVFGPVLHLLRYQRDQLPLLLAELRATGFGLTLAIHSRNQGFAEQIAAAMPVGNVYINRNQVGAEVEAQPFGGRGRSGTGPKAGGAHYLLRLVQEKCITTNLTAVGGNLDLLMGGDARVDVTA